MANKTKEHPLGETLGLSISLFKNHFILITKILFIYYIPYLIVSVIYESSITHIYWALLSLGLSKDSLPFQMSFYSIELGFTIIQIIPISLLLGTITHGISQSYLDKKVTVINCVFAAFYKWRQLTGACIVGGLAIEVGFYCFIIPGVFLLLIWFVIIPVIIVEGRPILESFKRSKLLMEGYKRDAFEALFILLFISIGILLFISIGMRILGIHAPEHFVSTIVLGMVQLFMISLYSIVSVVVYFSSRSKVVKFEP